MAVNELQGERQKGRVTERERQKDLPSTVHSSNGCIDQRSAELKVESGISSGSATQVQRSNVRHPLLPSSHYKELNRSGAARLGLMLIRDPGTAGGS